MAITIDSLVEVSLIQQTFAGQVYNVFGYEVTSGIGEVEGVSVGEAWWNYVKDEYRAMVRPTEAWLFSSVVVREMNNPTGVLAEWSIPTGEQQGSRTGVGTSEFLPPFNAAGFKMTVGSRATRPGQKRIGGLLEVDAVAWALDATYKALLVTLAEELCTTLTLAAPAATWNLTPNIFRKDATGAVTAHQAVTGYVINNNVTSQVWFSNRRAKWRREEKLRMQRRSVDQNSSSGRNSSGLCTTTTGGNGAGNGNTSSTVNGTNGELNNTESAAGGAGGNHQNSGNNTNGNDIAGGQNVQNNGDSGVGGVGVGNSISPPLQAVVPRLPLNTGFNAMYSSIPQPIATMSDTYNSMTSSLTSMPSAACLQQRDSYPYSMFHDPLSLGSPYHAVRQSCNPAAAHQQPPSSSQHAVYGGASCGSNSTGVISAGVSVPVQIQAQSAAELAGANYWPRLQ